jgi:ParB family chromosome partitioning protein
MNLGVTITNSLLIIPLEQIRPGVNHRGDVGDVAELAASIAALGQLQPLLVEETEPGVYTVFDGHRRLKALRQAKARYAKCVLRAAASPANRIAQQLALSLNGRAWDPIAESDAVYELFWTHNMDQAEIARTVGHSLAWVRGRLALHQATNEERRELAAGRRSVAEVQQQIAARRTARDGGVKRNHADVTAKAPAVRWRPKCPACGGTGLMVDTTAAGAP